MDTTYKDLIHLCRYSNLKNISDSEKEIALSYMRGNTLFFGECIMGDPELLMHYHVREPYARMHREINIELKAMQPGDRTAIVAPRDHAKTSFINLIYPLGRITFGMEYFILMISESERQSMFNLEALGNEVEFNPKYKFFFGNRKGSTWGKEEKIIISRPAYGEYRELVCDILVRGVGQKVRGLKFGPYRPTMTIADDFEGEANALTENERFKVRRWVNAQVIPGSATARTTFIGTIIDNESFLNRIAGSAAWKKGKYIRKGWKILFYQAIIQGTKPGEFVSEGKEIYENGVPKVQWPERKSYKWLMGEKGRLESEGDVAFFFQEYQNIPYTDAFRVFRKEDIQYWDGFYTIEEGIVFLHVRRLNGEPVKKKFPVNVFMGSDPASSENIKADYTVHMVVFVDKEYNIYIDRYFRGQVVPMTGADELWALMELFGEDTKAKQPKIINIEETGHVMLAGYIRRLSKEKGRFYNIQPQPAIKNKFFRIKEMQPKFGARAVFMREEHTELENELLNFRSHGTVKKDCLDAMRWAMEDIFPPNLVEKKGKWEQPEVKLYKDWQTGATFATLKEYNAFVGGR